MAIALSSDWKPQQNEQLYCSIWATETAIASLLFTLANESYKPKLTPLVLTSPKSGEDIISAILGDRRVTKYIVPFDPDAEKKSDNYWVSLLAIATNDASPHVAEKLTPIRGLVAHGLLSAKSLIDDKRFTKANSVNAAIANATRAQSAEMMAYLQAAAYARKRLINAQWISEV